MVSIHMLSAPFKLQNSHFIVLSDES